MLSLDRREDLGCASSVADFDDFTWKASLSLRKEWVWGGGKVGETGGKKKWELGLF